MTNELHALRKALQFDALASSAAVEDLAGDMRARRRPTPLEKLRLNLIAATWWDNGLHSRSIY